MLGQGLSSLIPPQKPQAGKGSEPGNTSSHSSPSTPAFTPPAREQHLGAGASHKQTFLPQEEEEKLLEPPAIIHEEPGKEIKTAPAIAASPTPPAISSHSVSTPPVASSASIPAATFIRPEIKKMAMGEAVFLIEVEKIKPNPHQPRRHFDEAALKDLASSIREHGILQPLVVTKIETEVPDGTAVEYQLIAGERRLMASKIVGLERVPVIVRTLDQGKSQSLELAIIENLQREDLNPVEMARAFARLQDEFRMTQREIATRLGKSRETVANTLRLLDLPFDVQESIATGKITESHGRLLLSLKDPALQDKLFRDLVSKSLTTRELRAQVAAGEGVKHREKKAMPELKMLQERLAAFLGAPVTINQTGESGRITINFYSHDELENILNHLAKTLGEDEHGV